LFSHEAYPVLLPKSMSAAQSLALSEEAQEEAAAHAGRVASKTKKRIVMKL
jgi:hypothetical protein